MFRKHEDIPKKSTNSTITYRLLFHTVNYTPTVSIH